MSMLALILASAFAAQTPDDAPPSAVVDAPQENAVSKNEDAKKENPEKPSTPEEALRAFLTAMVVQEEPTLRELTLSETDLEWLMKGEVPPKEQLESIKEQIAETTIQSLKSGDEVKMPGGRRFQVKDEDVAEGHAVLLVVGSPIPIRLQKIDDAWRVDATPIVAARKAAEAARKRLE